MEIYNSCLGTWQLPEWPKFYFDAVTTREAENHFLQEAGFLKGLLVHVSSSEQVEIKVSTLSEEAYKTSEIEGEHLDRDSLQSSIRRNFGLDLNRSKFKMAEQGVADMMTTLYDSYNQPLTHEMLFDWHSMLMVDDRYIQDIGKYRTHPDAMQVVSGAIDRPKVHYEAPPSDQVREEMGQFIDWFNQTAPGTKEMMPALARAGLAHFYFECIHPFEDGNGRIGRALILKSLCQSVQQPLLLALSYTIEKSKRAYYEALQKNNQTLEITNWQNYFAEVVLEALVYSQKLARFIVDKGKFYHRIEGNINDRQKAAVDRVLRDGPNSFPLGLNAEKYIRITGTSRATATRDLQDLVDKGFFNRTGDRKATRYRILFEYNEKR